MKQYLELLNYVLNHGEVKEDRTGTGTISVFGTKMTFDLLDSFPLLTTKKVPFKLVASELLWFIQGGNNYGKFNSLNTTDLKNIYTNNIWDEWADDNGDLGPIYGAQWRAWNGELDQLSACIYNLKNSPDSRRHIVSSWNVSDLNFMALPPCHLMFQFYVSKGEYLSCQMYQRSCDMFLGVPFNIASYALLTCMIANIVGLKPKRFTWVGGDTHIYKNHVDQVLIQLKRLPDKPPKLEIDRKYDNIEDFSLDSFLVKGYNPQRHIAAPISV